MGISFILGRAGMGKTRRCLCEIGEELRARPEGPGLYLLVPEQATFHMERALLSSAGVGASFRAQVVSFRRLAFRAMSERGLAALDPVGGLERLLVLRSILQRNRARLARYGRLARRPALAAELARAFSELARRRQTPDSLLAARERLLARPAAPRRLAEKLADLALLWREYGEALAHRALDPDTTLERLLEILARSDWAAGARFWVDGFSGFSPQEFAVLGALAGRAAELRVSLCLDPERLSELPADPRRLDPTRLFFPTEESYLRLVALRSVAGPVAGEPPDLHLVSELPPRQAASPPLAELERALARESDAPLAAGEALFVHEFASPRQEILAVAAEIARLTTEQGHRYREVAVVTRGIEEYASLIQRVFDEAGIPHFLDRRVPLRGHPLLGLVSAVLSLTAERARPALLDLIKTGLSGLSWEDADRLENHFLAEGVDGFNGLARAWPACGQPLLAALRGLEAALAARPRLLARDFCAALFDFLEERGVRATLENWIQRAESEGRLAELSQHRQAWEGLCQLLDQMVAALGQEEAPAAEWAEILALAASELQCALIPPALDQVLVGSIERSRHPELRAVFFVGTLEGTLPRPPGPGGLFSDAERRLLEELDCDAGPHASRLLAEESYLAYIAFTRPSERLILTYPSHDGQGRETVRSRWIDWLLARAPEALREISPAASDLFPRQRLARRLLELRESGHPESSPALAPLAGLLAHPQTRATALAALPSLWHEERAELPPALLDELGLVPDTISTTALEDYGKCPFLHHAARRLRLAERRLYRVDALQVGLLLHAFLEEYGRRVVERGGDWSALTREERSAGILPALEQVVEGSEAGALWLENPRNRHLLGATARRLEHVLAFLVEEAAGNGFRTVGVERAFAGEAGIALPDGRRIGLRGVIDRLDARPPSPGDAPEEGGEELYRVVDYKSGQAAFARALVERGVSLQLPAYALAAGRMRPGARLAGAFLLSLTPARKPAGGRRGASAAPTEAFKLRGFFDHSCLSALDPEVEPGRRSRFLSHHVKMDGAPGASGDGLSRQDLDSLLCAAQDVMAAKAAQLAAGRIAPDPANLYAGRGDKVKLPCAFCLYASVCRYDRYDLARSDGDDEEEEA